MSLGKNIAKHRKQRGWTQAEFADHVGMHKAHVTRIENDHIQPSRATLTRISEVLNTSVNELYVDGNPATAAPSLEDPLMHNAFQLAQELGSDDKVIVLRIIQALLTKRKMEQAMQWELPQPKAS